ncbi:MAG: hypothetical protein LBM93_02155 [Oscillospiraceae bacterium]|nr:hypothetical protein [Oscillospiraceae bacterium]
MDIFKKKKRRLIITGVAGVLALTGMFTGCSDRDGNFAGANGRVDNNRDSYVSEGLVTEIGDAVKRGAENVGTVFEGAKDGIKSGIDDIRNNDKTNTDRTGRANANANTTRTSVTVR